jgi:hypothetical protein
MKKWLKSNVYYFGLEWPYKNLKPGIICEKLIETEDGLAPKDYKFYCFNGNVKFLMLVSERSGHHSKMDFYDTKWNKLLFKQGGGPSEKKFDKPELLESMLEIARKLSQGFPHVRVDLYCENNRIIFGELTFFDGSGFFRFEPFEYDELIGSYFELPEKWL